jgi:hypothetical protein
LQRSFFVTSLFSDFLVVNLRWANNTSDLLLYPRISKMMEPETSRHTSLKITQTLMKLSTPLNILFLVLLKKLPTITMLPSTLYGTYPLFFLRYPISVTKQSGPSYDMSRRQSRQGNVIFQRKPPDLMSEYLFFCVGPWHISFGTSLSAHHTVFFNATLKSAHFSKPMVCLLYYRVNKWMGLLDYNDSHTKHMERGCVYIVKGRACMEWLASNDI